MNKNQGKVDYNQSKNGLVTHMKMARNETKPNFDSEVSKAHFAQVDDASFRGSCKKSLTFAMPRWW